MKALTLILIIASLFASVAPKNRKQDSAKKGIDKGDVKRALRELEEAGR